MESDNCESHIDGSGLVLIWFLDLSTPRKCLKIIIFTGTSSPEILLSIIETVGHHFEARKLGPNIIVGSAAFNLLIITSLCTLTLGLNEKRRIHDLKV